MLARQAPRRYAQSFAPREYEGVALWRGRWCLARRLRVPPETQRRATGTPTLPLVWRLFPQRFHLQIDRSQRRRMGSLARLGRGRLLVELRQQGSFHGPELLRYPVLILVRQASLLDFGVSYRQRDRLSSPP
jgi:hypothetical protein